MGLGISRLSDLEVKAWIKNPARTPKKLFDGDGLFLTMTPQGTPVWRLRYRLPTDKIFSIGKYPEIGLSEARKARDAARALIREGRDPVQTRKVDRTAATARLGDTFEEIAKAWLRMKMPGWSPAYQKTVPEQLENHVFKYIGSLPIQEVTDPVVATIIERLSDRVVTAQKVRKQIESIFDLAKARGKFEGDNPAISAKQVIPRQKLHGRRAALLTWPELGDLLRRAEAANLSSAVRMAHRLCAFTATRIGNVISAEWSEFNLRVDPVLWVIPRSKMKAQDRHFDHKVVIGKRFAEELRQWHKVTGGKGYLFPAVAGDSKFISPESIEKAYRVTLGLAKKHSPHGWRSAFSTLARDNGFDRDAIELALDHVHDNEVARAYDRGERLEHRVRLANWWGEGLVNAERGES